MVLSKDQLAYAQSAYVHGIKIIWNLKENVNTNLCSKYNGDFAFPHCTSNNDFIAQFVDFTKNLPATWGYYTDDEAGTGAVGTLQSVYQTVKAHTSLPVLIVEAYWSVAAVNANFPKLCNTADAMAVDYYPVGNPDGYTDINQTGPIAAVVNEQAYLCHKGTAMVLQVHSWSEYGHPGASYPSLAQEKSMITQAMNALVTPYTILWYSYFDNQGGINPTWPQPVEAFNLYPGPNTLPPPVPTPTSTPVPEVPPPTSTPTPTPVNSGPPPTIPPKPTLPIIGNAILSLSVGLDDIGSTGDNANTNARGNPNPKHPQRTIFLAFYNGNFLVSKITGNVTYYSGLGTFTGNINLSKLTSGAYTVYAFMKGFLEKKISGVVINSGKNNCIKSCQAY